MVRKTGRALAIVSKTWTYVRSPSCLKVLVVEIRSNGYRSLGQWMEGKQFFGVLHGNLNV